MYISNLPTTFQDKLFDLMKNWFGSLAKKSAPQNLPPAPSRRNVFLKRTLRVLVVYSYLIYYIRLLYYFSYCSGGKFAEILRTTGRTRPGDGGRWVGETKIPTVHVRHIAKSLVPLRRTGCSFVYYVYDKIAHRSLYDHRPVAAKSIDHGNCRLSGFKLRLDSHPRK